MNDQIFKTHLDNFASSINGGKIGLVKHEPEKNAKPLSCYKNVRDQVETFGGGEFYGWTFLSKRSELGDYLIAQHHSIWGKSDKVALDITPYLDNQLPLMVNGSVLFLLDLLTPPIIINGYFAPTPSKFYALTRSQKLLAYLEDLQNKESTECEHLYKQLQGA